MKSWIFDFEHRDSALCLWPLGITKLLRPDVEVVITGSFNNGLVYANNLETIHGKFSYIPIFIYNIG